MSITRLAPPLAALAAVLVAAAPALAREREAPRALPVQSDRDGDGVLEELESRLGGLGAREEVRVIVRLRAPADRPRVERLERAVGAFGVRRRFSVVDAVAATVTPGQVRALAARDDVRSVESDSPVRALNDTAQDSFGVTKARLDAPSLDGNGAGPADVYSPADLVAAVIDTGIDPSHPDLDEGKVLEAVNCLTGTCVSTPAFDDQGHGTHVAATIAGDGDGSAGGRLRGVAPAAGLVGVKVLGADGTGLDSGVLAGIEWAVDNRVALGIEALNLSLGGEGCSNGSDALSAAANAAADRGLVVSVAAGNNGPGTCTIGPPGAADRAITVGAMADTGVVADPANTLVSGPGFYQGWFSSRGAPGGPVKPDVSAPGVDVTSACAAAVVAPACADGYDEQSGTSMAAPFVTGVALLMRDASPSLTPQQVKDRIRQTAVDWARGGDNRTAGSSGPDIDFGAGRLDAYRALRAAGASLHSPPGAPSHRLLTGTLDAAGPPEDRVDDHPIDVRHTRFPVAVNLLNADVLGATSTTRDLDVEVLDPNGGAVAASAFTSRQDEAGFQPAQTGTYTVRVRAAAGAGQYVLDVSAPLDGSPPETTITAGPSGTSSQSSATFSFGSDEAGGGFDCRLDGGPWRGCPSPHAVAGLADGPHGFEVRAVDGEGNADPTPASRTWTVDTTPPAVAAPAAQPVAPAIQPAPAISRRGRTRLVARRRRTPLLLTGAAASCAPGPAACTVAMRVQARLRPGGRLVTIASRTVPVPAGARRSLSAPLSRRGAALLARAGRLRSTIRLAAAVGAGRPVSRRYAATLRAPRPR